MIFNLEIQVLFNPIEGGEGEMHYIFVISFSDRFIF